MKLFLLPALISILALSACSSDKSASTEPSTMEPTATAGALPEPANNLPEPTQPAPEPANRTAPAPNTNTNTTNYQPWTPPNTGAGANTAAQSTPKFPKGMSSGKKGFVKSPYAEHAGLVDVQGFPAGTVVKCPFTGKNFIVP
jgi:hypothetical protein